jgi:hypothetical protein
VLRGGRLKPAAIENSISAAAQNAGGGLDHAAGLSGYYMPAPPERTKKRVAGKPAVLELMCADRRLVRPVGWRLLETFAQLTLCARP